MKKDTLTLLLVLSLIGQIILLFTPWFSYNVFMMGYYAGWNNFEFFLAQFVFAFYYFTKGKEQLWEKLLLELSLLSIPLVLLHIAEVWVKSMNIASRINFEESLRLALPCYWIAFGVSFISLLLCQLMFIAGAKEKLNSGRIS